MDGVEGRHEFNNGMMFTVSWLASGCVTFGWRAIDRATVGRGMTAGSRLGSGLVALVRNADLGRPVSPPLLRSVFDTEKNGRLDSRIDI